MARKTRVKKKRVRLSTDEGLVFVHSSFNNTIISLTDRSGNVLAWSSGGKIGYKGSRKSTPFAAQMAATEVAKIGMEMGIQKVGVIVKGPGGGRESSIRAINAAGIKVTMIKDETPIPHNGCRPPKTRRI
ncbi:MAG: 30S ribosomal protein S11 [Candidatus Cloacimonadaceae bacterium]|jgi:small subunit ribosomal protein S11|nr:30S ribosomal protein S11 [Candidatus Cloacimonadota bacterium]MDY0127511.1 30S ribosomal protein S11 [Candidatus Cloacimonadaceae bacterium]MCB5254713.1 30S ribosomal protein S11 [Candidatus Cloacimonadota bacterium]MCK9177968.1 30S ribosomal protein S11 [Candidatus Cloacimonadota bacterium]MCK9242370.1 30S ribosomal protein S11 [Candidatus Cloacimonadota bacterium]